MIKLALIGVMALAFVAASQARSPLAPAAYSATAAKKTVLLRDTARRWEALMALPKAWTRSSPGTPRSLRFWRQRYRAVVRAAAHPPHKDGWLCIHSGWKDGRRVGTGEGSWSDADDPYWGGLQMNRGFMQTYAPLALLRRGWANRWTPLEQMWVAERAHRSGRGYGPWPNTARSCGLL